MNSFLSIDFEIANPCLDSICQIGISEFENGIIKQRWNYYVDPEDWFDPANIMIHGITPEMVMGKPTFIDLYPDLKKLLSDRIVVHHTPFDKTAFNQVCNKYSIEIPSIKWLDSSKIVRRTWLQFKDRGYGLSPVCNFLGIDLNHHDALNDAIASGKIVLSAISETGLSINEWLDKINLPITSRTRENSAEYAADYKSRINKEGNPNGLFYGEVIVFSGTFFQPKENLSIIASDKGCKVENAFTSRTTILVVGTQNPKALKGQEKSSKHKAAEKRIAKGEDVRILSENDFMSMFGIQYEYVNKGEELKNEFVKENGLLLTLVLNEKDKGISFIGKNKIDILYDVYNYLKKYHAGGDTGMRIIIDDISFCWAPKMAKTCFENKLMSVDSFIERSCKYLGL